MKPAENTDAINQAQQDKRWMLHTMALAARAEGTGEIPVGTAPMFKAHRQYKEVRA